MAEFLVNHSWIIILILFWTLPWKAVALWRSVRQNQMGWFLSMLVLNTLGILEIVYIFFFSVRENKPEMSATSNFETKFGANQDVARKIAARKIVV